MTTVVAQDTLQVSRVSKGKITSAELSEISGIIPSINNPGMFWVHNDSGDAARLFLIDSVANLKTSYTLEGIEAKDIEDIAWVELEGISYVVLADIGDNLANRAYISLYVFPEPHFSPSQKLDTIAQADVQIKHLNYSGKARDAESVFVDPRDKQFYLISKREFKSVLYTAPIFSTSTNHLLLKPVLTLPFTFVTSADISPRGDAVLIKNLTSIFYWKLNDNDDLLKALKQPYFSIPYKVEPQGEAIAFNRVTNGFFTLSERPLGLDSYLYYYKFSKPL